jgi:hypothetical protein
MSWQTEHWLVMSQGRIPSPGSEENSDVKQQLVQLFGESLIGPWRSPDEFVASSPILRRRGVFRKNKLIVGVVGLCILLTSGWLLHLGLTRQAILKRIQVARNLESFLREGELERAAQYLALLQGETSSLVADDPHLDLILRGEAMVFRYHDADPKRFERIRPYLTEVKQGPIHPQRFLAAMTLRTRKERAGYLAEFSAIQPGYLRDPEFYFLWATALDSQGEKAAAQRAWNRSFELGPLWLAHRYEQIGFEIRQKNPNAPLKLLHHLERVAPDSIWTCLAQERLGHSVAEKIAGTSPTIPGKPMPKVAIFHQHLSSALVAAQANHFATAQERLQQSLLAIGGQAPFVLDAFDRLIEVNANRLAYELTKMSLWPRHSNEATNRLDDLNRLNAPQEEKPRAILTKHLKAKKHKHPTRHKSKTRVHR